MKKIRNAAIGLALGLFVLAAAGTAAPRQAAAAGTQAKKSGLQKEGKQYFFYAKGKKVKNQWKKVGKYKYYFGKKGAAKKGLCIIKGKRYYFDKKCRMVKNRWYKKTYYFDGKGRAVTGIQCIKKNYVCKLYYFDQNGKIDQSRQAILDAYNNNQMYQKSIAPLKAVLGEPLKIEYPEDRGCMGAGRDVIVYYKGFRILGNEDKGVIYFQAFER